MRSQLATAGGASAAANDESTAEKDAEIAELREAVEERDAIIETAKEKYQAMGQKARAAVEERNEEILSLTEQLEQVCAKIELTI